jgi:hypothetical protein
MENPLKNWKTIFLLSIVVPVSFLTTFKLTGIFREPLVIAETINLTPKYWTFQRPSEVPEVIYIDKNLNSTYADNQILVNFLLILGVYQENNPAYNGRDVVTMRIAINTTSINQATIENVYVVFQKDVRDSLVGWLPLYFKLENLSMMSHSSGGTMNGHYEETYAILEGMNHPSKIVFEGSILWSLTTPNSETHQIELDCEVTYYNGTAYKKIVQSFDLAILGMKGSE